MLTTFLLPYYCIFCKARSDQARDLCRTCENRLPYVTHACAQCANPLPLFHIPLLCGKCLSSSPYFDSTFALCYYESPFTRLITQLKFHGQLGLSTLLGHLMVDRLIHLPHHPELIIPIPLHKTRLRERGFNQAIEIARPIAKHLQIPLDITHTQRHRYTHAQSDIAANLRYKNVRHAFSVKGILPKNVAIIDDVMTTGHTVNEFARTLKSAGVEHVQVWCCARTPMNIKT